MIINRKYVPLWKLKETDKEAMEVFDKAFNNSYLDYSEEEKKNLYQEFMQNCLYQFGIGTAFSKIIEVKNFFALLDKQKPYDNGFTFEDVTETEIVGKNKDYIILHLLNKVEDIRQIVNVVEIENHEKQENNEVKDFYSQLAKLYLDYKQGKKITFTDEINENKDYFYKVAEFLKTVEAVSIATLQIKLSIGYPRAAKTLDTLEQMCLVEKGKKGKKVLKPSVDDFIAFLDNN